VQTPRSPALSESSRLFLLAHIRVAASSRGTQRRHLTRRACRATVALASGGRNGQQEVDRKATPGRPARKRAQGTTQRGPAGTAARQHGHWTGAQNSAAPDGLSPRPAGSSSALPGLRAARRATKSVTPSGPGLPSRLPAGVPGGVRTRCKQCDRPCARAAPDRPPQAPARAR
jgi:hypothetical protein